MYYALLRDLLSMVIEYLDQQFLTFWSPQTPSEPLPKAATPNYAISTTGTLRLNKKGCLSY